MGLWPGKAARSFDRAEARSALHIVMAFGADARGSDWPTGGARGGSGYHRHLTSALFATDIRARWGIGNALLWVLGVTLRRGQRAEPQGPGWARCASADRSQDNACRKG